MRKLLIAVCLLLVFQALIFQGCSLFRKTSKTTVSDVKELRRLAEASTATEKATGSYSELFTFRRDGSVYQYQYIKDTTNEVKLEAVKVLEKQTDVRKESVKETEPVKFWLYAGAGLGAVLFVVYLIKRRAD